MTVKRLSMVGFAVVALLAACGPSSQPHSPSPQASPTIDAPLRTAIASVIAPNDAGFTVVYQWTRGMRAGEQGAFVWRQADLERRWDSIVSETDGSRHGAFSVTRLGTRDTAIESCQWFQKPNATNVSVECGRDSASSGDPTGGIVEEALAHDFVSGVLPSRVIAGHGARCFAYLPIVGTEGAVCTDTQSNVPLYFRAQNAFSVVEELEAVSVGATAPQIYVPDLPLETNATPVISTTRMSELGLPEVPISALQ